MFKCSALMVPNLGAIQKCREVSVEKMSLICWCKKSSFLVLSFPKNDKYHISKIEAVEEDVVKEEKTKVKKRRKSSLPAVTENEVDEFLREITELETQPRGSKWKEPGYRENAHPTLSATPSGSKRKETASRKNVHPTPSAIPSGSKQKKSGSRENTYPTPSPTPAKRAAVEIVDLTTDPEDLTSVQSGTVQNGPVVNRVPDLVESLNTQATKRPMSGPSDEAPAEKRKRLDDSAELSSFKYRGSNFKLQIIQLSLLCETT